MYMNMDGTVLSSWDRNIALGEKVDSEFLKNIQQKLPSRTDSFSIHKDGEEQLVTYIFNKSLTSFLCTPCLIIISIPKFIPCFAES